MKHTKASLQPGVLRYVVNLERSPAHALCLMRGKIERDGRFVYTNRGLTYIADPTSTFVTEQAACRYIAWVFLDMIKEGEAETRRIKKDFRRYDGCPVRTIGKVR